MNWCLKEGRKVIPHRIHHVEKSITNLIFHFLIIRNYSKNEWPAATVSRIKLTKYERYLAYCSFAYQKIEKNLNVSICHVVAEADRYVPGLATAKSRVLKLEELAKICSVQYWSLKNSVPILMPSSRGFDLWTTFSRERIRQFKNRRALCSKELNSL